MYIVCALCAACSALLCIIASPGCRANWDMYNSGPPFDEPYINVAVACQFFWPTAMGFYIKKKSYEKVWIYASLVALHTPRSTSLHRKLVRGRLVSELVVEVVRATAGLAMAKKEKKGRNGTNILKCNTLDSPTHQRVLMCQCICTFKLHTRDESPIP